MRSILVAVLLSAASSPAAHAGQPCGSVAGSCMGECSAGFDCIPSPSGCACNTARNVEIAQGVVMPVLSLGTCCGSVPQVGIPAWRDATAWGGGENFYGVDTAWDYKDEGAIAPLLAGELRNEVFVTTKVPAGVGAHSGNTTDCAAATGKATALAYVRDNLRQLNLSQVDLVLLHGPCEFAVPPVPNATASNQALWEGLEEAQRLGLTKAIGVSNYDSNMLAALQGTKPAVNQCRMGVVVANTSLPLKNVAHDDETIAYCAAHGITYEAWRVVGGCPLQDPRLQAIASKHKKTPAQICLKWTLQRGATAAIGTGGDAAKAAQYSRDDFDMFDWLLSEEEMAALNTWK